MAPARRIPSPWTLALAALAAAATLYLGVPRLVAALTALPGNPALRAIQDGNSVAPADLHMLIESRRAAADWVDDGRLLTDAALGELMVSAGADGTAPAAADRAAALGRAVADLERGLALRPASPHAWGRLAVARLRRDGPGPAVLAALRQSVYTGPYDPRLAFPRIELLLAHAPLIGEDRALLERQIRFAWRVSPHRLATLAHRLGAPFAFNRALAADPAALAGFEARLRTLRAGEG